MFNMIKIIYSSSKKSSTKEYFKDFFKIFVKIFVIVGSHIGYLLIKMQTLITYFYLYLKLKPNIYKKLHNYID